MTNNQENTSATKSDQKKPTGRPPKYSDPEIMENAINEYFSICDAGENTKWITKKKEVVEAVLPIPPTLEGLTLHLGFADYSSLLQYGKKELFLPIFTRARTKIIYRLHLMAMRGQVDPSYCLCVIKKYDPSYNDKITLDISATFDVGGALQKALSLASGPPGESKALTGKGVELLEEPKEKP